MRVHRFVEIWMVVGVIMGLTIGCGGKKNESQGNNNPPTSLQTPSQTVTTTYKGNAEKGKTYFLQFCSSCHGQNALGLKGLGKDLVHSQFIQEKTDQELLEYVKKGRPVNDPLNTTGVPMPPKGGNPALTDEQILDIIAYLRTIHQ